MLTLPPFFRKCSPLCLIALLLGVTIPAQGEEPAAKPMTLDAAMTGGTEQVFGERLLEESNQQMALWWCSSGWKISPFHPAPQTMGQAVRISAAKNEAEAAQLVIFPYKTIQHFSASISELKGPGEAIISPEQVDILRVYYVSTPLASDDSTLVGLWPDPLPPLPETITLQKGQNFPLWVRIRVPKGIPAGNYQGTIQLTGDGVDVQTPISADVYDFELPDQMTCTTAFGFSSNLAFRYHGITDPGQKREVLAKYLKCLSDHHITPYEPAPLDSFHVTWPEIKAGETPDPGTLKPTIDWTAWDKAMQEAFDVYHFTTVQLPAPGMGSGTFFSRQEPELLGFKEDTPQYKAAFRHYWQAVQEHLRKKGWLGKAFVYWFDEPTPKDYEFVKNGFNKLKEAAPDIQRMLTEEVNPALFGNPTIWCPQSNEFKMDDAAPRQALGEKFWWYVCTNPKAPYCTLFIDHPATELRVWLWQTWQRKINGLLVWESNYWHSNEAYPDPKAPQNPYEDPMGWQTGYEAKRGDKNPWGNGDGRFVYPPEAAANGNPSEPVLDPPVVSIRLEMLRDGIEDYEYLTILKNRLAQASNPPEEFTRLLEVSSAITTSMTEFTRIPAPIEKQREEIARAIEKIK